MPPCDFEASSIEYCFTTFLNGCPESSAFLAWSALASVLVRTTRRSRRSGWAKRFLFFS